uniref:Abhydrolase_4 domain-containing protein n=1 Tax=Macrostomum lignano TaxID=282301 RepID=A0A1I8F4M6_9PLAT
AFLIGGRRRGGGAAGGSAAPPPSKRRGRVIAAAADEKSKRSEQLEALLCLFCQFGSFLTISKFALGFGNGRADIFVHYGHGLSEGNVNQLRSIDTLVDVAAAHLAKLKLEFPDCNRLRSWVFHGRTGYCTECAAGARSRPVSHGVAVTRSAAGGMKPDESAECSSASGCWPRLPNLPLPGGRFRPEDLTRSKETPGSITLPTLLITGTADRIADPARSALCAAGQALGKPVTGRAYLGARHQAAH